MSADINTIATIEQQIQALLYIAYAAAVWGGGAFLKYLFDLVFKKASHQGDTPIQMLFEKSEENRQLLKKILDLQQAYCDNLNHLTRISDRQEKRLEELDFRTQNIEHHVMEIWKKSATK